MSDLLNVLILLCGIDYSKTEYDACVVNTKVCYEEAARGKKFPKGRNQPFSEEESKIFYKCYSSGAPNKTLPPR